MCKKIKICLSRNLIMRNSISTQHGLRGFTLIELMVTLTLVAILSMLAVPSFNQIIQSTRLSSTTNELYTSFVQAKSEAVRRGKRVTVCASADGTTCSGNVAGWNTGWITFVDSTRTGTLSLDPGEDVIAIGQAVSESLSISGASFFSFSADARSRDMTGGFLATNLRVCSKSSALDDSRRSRIISTIASGRLNVLVEPNLTAAACP
jgi:type IV fimbrial biogenesis protein FimT